MKNNKKTIIFSLVAISLLMWNLFLTTKLYQKPELVDGPNDSNTVVQNSTYATTDLTKAAEKGNLKTVAIATGSGSGSGAIYQAKADGDKYKVTIITNYHVVTTNKEVDVLFANGQTIVGKVIGGDIFTDLAVVEVETNFKVEAFTIGDSSTLKLGEWVLAIGSPLGLEFSGSVSEGIISGIDRILGVDLNKDGVDDWDMLVAQTTAAINPGNSGGPLINLNGDLIGINSMKISQSSVEGMAFSIPINEAIPIVEQLIQTGEVVRPLIGLSARSLSDFTMAQRSYYGLPLDVEDGIVVTDVIDRSAAEKAGIEVGDIIVKINQDEVVSFKDFRINLYKHKKGDVLSLTIQRANEALEIDVTLEW